MEITQQGIPQDSLRTVLQQVFETDDFRWEETPEVTSWLMARFQELMLWLQGLQDSSPATYWTAMAIALLLLVAILIHFGYLIVKALRYRPETGVPTAPRLAEVWDDESHLREARRLSEAGRFGEALGHRFTALVLRLDRRRALRFHPAKTPAEYAREAKVDEAGRSLLDTLVVDLYGHVFGGAPCTSAQWLTFDQAALEVERRVAA